MIIPRKPTTVSSHQRNHAAELRPVDTLGVLLATTASSLAANPGELDLRFTPAASELPAYPNLKVVGSDVFLAAAADATPAGRRTSARADRPRFRPEVAGLEDCGWEFPGRSEHATRPQLRSPAAVQPVIASGERGGRACRRRLPPGSQGSGWRTDAVPGTATPVTELARS